MFFLLHIVRNAARFRWGDCLVWYWNQRTPIGVFLNPAGTGLAVFLVKQATQARRHKTRLHSSSANTLLAARRTVKTARDLPKERPIVTPDMGRPPANYSVGRQPNLLGLVALFCPLGPTKVRMDAFAAPHTTLAVTRRQMYAKPSWVNCPCFGIAYVLEAPHINSREG